MAIRNRIRPGDYLMVDDLSGTTHYASEMVRNWDGAWVHHSKYEMRNPQEFVRSRKEEQPRVVRPDDPTAEAANAIGVFIGLTTIRVPTNNAAAHLYDPGIGDMEVGLNFVVR